MKSKREWVKRTFNRKRYYLRILVSFIIVAVSSTLVISSIFSNILTQDLKEQLSTDYINSVDRVRNEFDNTFLQLRQMSIYLRQSPDINDFLIMKKNDYVTGNSAFNYFSSVTNLNPYLYSVILYNRNMSYSLVSGNSGIDVSQFITKKLDHLYVTSAIDIVQSEILRKDISGFQPRKSISILFTEEKSSVIQNAVIMTINQDEVEKKILSSLNSTVVVATKDGEVIFNPYHTIDSASIADQSYFGNITSSSSGEGSFMFKINSEKCIVTYSKSKETGFYIISIMNMKDYTSFVNQKMYPFIFATALVFVALCIAVVALSRGIYNPVKRFKEKIATSAVIVESEFSNEFDEISSVFANTLEQLKNLQYRYEARSEIIKEDFLRDLLKKGAQSESAEAIPDFNLSIDFHHLFTVCILIDNYNKMNNDERMAYRATLCKMIPEVLHPLNNREMVSMFDGELVLLLNAQNDSDEVDALLSAMERVRESIQNTLQITVTMGIGPQADGIDEVQSSYQKALEMAQYRFILGPNRVIYQYYNSMENANADIPDELKSKLINAVKTSNTDLYMESLDRLMTVFKNCSYSEAAINLYHIISILLKTIRQTAITESRDILGFDEKNISLSSFETMEQARMWMIGVFSDYQKEMQQMTQRKNSKYYDVVEKSKSYILDHYNDMTLSVDMLAEQVGYAPYYYSKIFKSVSGINITDFIKQVRMNKAQEILIRTDTRINDIAELVGFPSASHFYTIFKAEVGLTPAAYREYYQNSKITDI